MAHPGIASARAGWSGFLLGAALSVLGASLGGCEPPEYGPEGPDDGDTTKTGTASLVLTNRRETDPGPLTFHLYLPGAQDIENLDPEVSLPPVDFGKSRTVSVTPGRWKVAYSLESGDLRPMPPDGEEATSEDWPVVVFAKGKTYSIRIETDDGGHTVWRTDLAIED